MQSFKEMEFSGLYEEFIDSGYLESLDGMRHLNAYEEGRTQGRLNIDSVLEARKREEDVTDLVLLKLLPHSDTKGNRDKGAWVHIAPAIQGSVKRWFEGAGWTKPEDWPAIAEAILRFVERCNENPDLLPEACDEFARLPYVKGFQAGMLTPILNALRPEDYLLVNDKSRKTINYFSEESHEPKIVSEGYALIEGGKLKTGMLVRDIGGNAEDGSVPTGENVVEEITEIRPASPSHGREFVNLVLKRVGTDEERTKFLSKTKRVAAKAAAESANRDNGDQGIRTGALTSALTDYPVLNAAGRRLIEEFAGELDRPGAPELSDADRFDMFSHWLVAVRKYDFHDRRDRKSTSGAAQKPGSGGKGLFSTETFDLLAGLHDDPTKTYYQENRDGIKHYVEEPFQRLVREVAQRLPTPISGLMETEKRIFAQILKNDYGRGGAWDFYWGAYYPKGGKRIRDAQLSTWINRDQLEFGFYIGHYGSDQRERFLANCRKYQEDLVALLEPTMGEEGFVYGDDKGYSPDSRGQSLSQWLENVGGAGIDVSRVIIKERVLELSEGRLLDVATRTFETLFPFVLLATSDDPMPEIVEYLGMDEDVVETASEYGLAELCRDTGLEEEDLSRWVRAIDRKGQAIIYGPPGTGKTFVAQHLAKHIIGGRDGFCEIVQFHPSYSYEDFMQGIRPESQNGTLSYPVVPGRFKEFCREAAKRENPCVLIIDEINRANLSRVFGELMYLLEYRDAEVPLAGGGKFRIPKNVRLIGTMNTADRSIALVDYALRRRFAFLELYPDYDLLRNFHSRTGFPVEGLIGELRELNARINDPHYAVGITFFLRRDLEEELEDIWRMEIEPYLEEYFFDQPAVVEQYRWDRVGDTLIP